MLTLPDVLQLGYESQRLFIADQYKVFCPPACSVYTLQRQPSRADNYQYSKKCYGL
jgi:hypothetical protein